MLTPSIQNFQKSDDASTTVVEVTSLKL